MFGIPQSARSWCNDRYAVRTATVPGAAPRGGRRRHRPGRCDGSRSAAARGDDRRPRPARLALADRSSAAADVRHPRHPGRADLARLEPAPDRPCHPPRRGRPRDGRGRGRGRRLRGRPGTTASPASTSPFSTGPSQTGHRPRATGSPTSPTSVAPSVARSSRWRWSGPSSGRGGSEAISSVITGLVGALLITVVGKDVTGRARPPQALAVPPFEVSASFSSGHTLNATVLAGLAAYLLLIVTRRWWLGILGVVLAFGYAATMGLSRVWLGHRWLTDVVAGWLLGAAWVLWGHHRPSSGPHRAAPRAPGGTGMTEPTNQGDGVLASTRPSTSPAHRPWTQRYRPARRGQCHGRGLDPS